MRRFVVVVAAADDFVDFHSHAARIEFAVVLGNTDAVAFVVLAGEVAVNSSHTLLSAAVDAATILAGCS